MIPLYLLLSSSLKCWSIPKSLVGPLPQSYGASHLPESWSPIHFAYYLCSGTTQTVTLRKIRMIFKCVKFKYKSLSKAYRDTLRKRLFLLPVIMSWKSSCFNKSWVISICQRLMKQVYFPNNFFPPSLWGLPFHASVYPSFIYNILNKSLCSGIMWTWRRFQGYPWVL